MKQIIEKFYALIFEDKDKEEQEEAVPYANKVFMFYFAIIATTVALVIIVLDIIKNVSKINNPAQ